MVLETFEDPFRDEKHVSQLLDSATDTLERARSRLIPDTPDTPSPSTKGKAPAHIQQPMPPVSKIAPIMAAPATKLFGMAPEQFDGTSAKAKTFLSALQNYYYLNSDLFSSQSCHVASTLSHFKVGTSAGEWACD